MGFSGPDGTRVVDSGDTGFGTGPRKLTLTGKTVFKLPAYADYRPSATVLVGDMDTKDVVVSNATGKTIRTLARPAGWSECWAGHWTSDITFTQVCSTGTKSAVYRFSTTGAAPVRLTAAAFNWQKVTDSWTTSGRQVVSVDGECARFAVVRGSRLSLYNPKATKVSAQGVVAGKLYYGPSIGCGQTEGSRLVTVNASTGSVTTLAGGTRNPGKLVYGSLVIG